MLNKIFRIVTAVSILFLSVELYHDHYEKIEGYYFCNDGCSNNEHHVLSEFCPNCINPQKTDSIKSILFNYKFKSSKSKIYKNRNINYSFTSYQIYNKSPPEKV